MSYRMNRIASSLVNSGRLMMSGFREDWLEDLRDAVLDLSSVVKDFAVELEEGDLEGIGTVESYVKRVRRHQSYLDNPVLIREIDVLLEGIQKLLNTVEVERRRKEDADRAHESRCKGLSRDALGISQKVKVLEVRI